MTTSINPNGYAVVYLEHPDGIPRVCKGLGRGTLIGDTYYAIFDDAAAAAEEFLRWPCWDSGYGSYGILPAWMVTEERPQYVLKDSAR